MSIDSEIMMIRSKISEQQSINSRLRSELSTLSYGVDEASNNWENLSSRINNTLINGGQRMEDSHSITLRAYELEGEVEKMFALYKQVELANKRIRECKNKMYYDFANYRAVRKIVEALLNNIETAYVSDRTLMKAIEVKHLQLPDYWLTCAMIALMAWKQDDRKTAERALNRACRLELKNTSIFFFAMYIRLGRFKTALKWFKCYEQCEHTGEDQNNVLILFSIMNETLREHPDDQLVDYVTKYIEKMLYERLHDNGFNSDDAVMKIMCCLNSYKASDPINYPVLSKYCTEKDYLVGEMNAAKSNINYLDMILKIINISAEEKKNYLNDFILDIITRSNNSEKEVRNEITRNEFIIAYQGDVESAGQAYSDYIVHSESAFDIVNEMVDWIYHPAGAVGNTERRRMFILLKDLNRSAVANKVRDYRSRFKRILHIKANDYETDADMTSLNAENSRIESFYKAKESMLLANIKTWPCFIWFGLAAASVVGAIALNQLTLLVGTAAGIAGGILKIILTNRERKNISKNCEIESTNVKEIFAKIFEEFSLYEKEFNEYDRYYDDIEAEFDKI